jgi:AraC family transcriptional regulator, L-rhamnose operon regulatory protein RhaS
MNHFQLLDISRRLPLLFHMERATLTGPFSLHTHDFIELTVILNGKATHTIHSQAYEVTAGDVYVLLGDTQHGFDHVRELELFNVMLPADIIPTTRSMNGADPAKAPDGRKREQTVGEMWGLDSEIRSMPGFQALFILEPFYRREHRFTNKLHVDPHRLGRLEAILSSMLEEYRHGKAGWNALLRAAFLELVVSLSRWAEDPLTFGTGNLRAIAQAVAYLESHFDEPLQIGELARRAHLSIRHFSRIFAENYGLPPLAYLQGLRLRHACTLLRQSGLQVTRIAQECGYRDGNLFCRQFKARYGLSPTQYRAFLT